MRGDGGTLVTIKASAAPRERLVSTMLDVLRRPYPWDPRQLQARVVILIIVVASMTTLIGLGVAPRAVVEILVAAVLTAGEVAELILRPRPGAQR